MTSYDQFDIGDTLDVGAEESETTEPPQVIFAQADNVILMLWRV